MAGPPVDLSGLYDRPQDAATLREATERVMSAITALLADIRGETPPDYLPIDDDHPIRPGGRPSRHRGRPCGRRAPGASAGGRAHRRDAGGRGSGSGADGGG